MRLRPKNGTIRTGFLLLAAGLTLPLSLELFNAPAHAAAASSIVYENTVTQSTSISSSGTTITGATGQTYAVTCSFNGAATLTMTSNFTADTTSSATTNPAMFFRSDYVTSARNGTSYTWTCNSTVNGTLHLIVTRITGLTNAVPTVTSATGVANTAASAPSLSSTGYKYFYISAATATNTSFNNWSNGYTTLSSASQGGPTARRLGWGTAVYDATTSVTGLTSTSSTTTNPWRTWGVVYSITPPAFNVNIVDATDVTVTSPSFAMTPITSGFSCQTATGTIGTTSQKIRVSNDETPSWTLSIAATGGTTSTWTGTNGSYSYNNAAGSGCTGGQLTLNFAPATWATTCTNAWTNVTRNATSTAFANGSVDSITIMSASTADVACTRDVYGITASQQVPAEQRSGTYSLGLTLTLTAL